MKTKMIELHDLTEAGVSDIEFTSVTDNDRNKLIDLLEYSTTFDADQVSEITRQIENAETPAKFLRLQQIIFANTIQDKDRIAMGLPYNATDIKKTIRHISHD